MVIHHSVEEAIKLVSLSDNGKLVEFDNRCDISVKVQGYPQKLVQVFVNLLSNAADASSPGQSVLISTKSIGKYLLISVRDHGQGISDEHLAKVFEPFFTTKNVGEGTGLGLSLSYNIIQELGGSISVFSESGDGCEFEISLPLYVDEPAHKQEFEA